MSRENPASAVSRLDVVVANEGLTGPASAAPETGRPWGAYRAVDNGPAHQVKRIVVAPGGVLSRQKHFRRSEHWIVVEGEGEVEIDGALRLLRANQSVFIPCGAVHRLSNRAAAPLHLIEVQCGDYFGEDDIVRFDDVYGRAAA